MLRDFMLKTNITTAAERQDRDFLIGPRNCYTPFVNPGRSSMAGHTSGPLPNGPSKIILMNGPTIWQWPDIKIFLEHASVAKMARPDARLPARPQNYKILATP
jgi:hypothetical protein